MLTSTSSRLVAISIPYHSVAGRQLAGCDQDSDERQRATVDGTLQRQKSAFLGSWLEKAGFVLLTASDE